MATKLSILIGASALALSAGWANARTVCYVTAADAHAYVTPANNAIAARAAELGVELIQLSQNFDVQTGTEQMNTCIARNVDGIILWPLDPQAYIPGLARAKAAGIPSILINSPMDAAANDFIQSFTGPDTYQQGGMAADSLHAAMNGEGTVIVIAGQAENGTTIGRVGGFVDRLAEIGSGIEVLETVNADFDQQKALVASRDLITRFGDRIQGVYANDDTMARGFIDAWKEARPGQAMPVVIGISAISSWSRPKELAPFSSRMPAISKGAPERKTYSPTASDTLSKSSPAVVVPNTTTPTRRSTSSAVKKVPYSTLRLFARSQSSETPSTDPRRRWCSRWNRG